MILALSLLLFARADNVVDVRARARSQSLELQTKDARKGFWRSPNALYLNFKSHKSIEIAATYAAMQALINELVKATGAWAHGRTPALKAAIEGMMRVGAQDIESIDQLVKSETETLTFAADGLEELARFAMLADDPVDTFFVVKASKTRVEFNLMQLRTLMSYLSKRAPVDFPRPRTESIEALRTALDTHIRFLKELQKNADGYRHVLDASQAALNATPYGGDDMAH